jgi:excisionase family DNA binding protein
MPNTDLMTELNEHVSELCRDLGGLRQLINILAEVTTDRRNRQDPAVLDMKAASTYLSTTRHSLYDLVQRGGIPCRRIGRKIVFVQAELDAWLQQLPGITVAQAIASIKPEHREMYVRKSVRIRYEDPETPPCHRPRSRSRVAHGDIMWRLSSKKRSDRLTTAATGGHSAGKQYPSALVALTQPPAAKIRIRRGRHNPRHNFRYICG